MASCDLARKVLELFDESAGSHVSAQSPEHVGAVGPPGAKNRDTSHHRDLARYDRQDHRKSKTFSADLENKFIRKVWTRIGGERARKINR